jgi:hypothetical protein
MFMVCAVGVLVRGLCSVVCCAFTVALPSQQHGYGNVVVSNIAVCTALASSVGIGTDVD